MDDDAPQDTPEQKIAKKIASRIGMLRADQRHVRVKAFQEAVNVMKDENLTWSDVGNWMVRGADARLYTEAEMQEFRQAAHAAAVEEGIKLGEARASNGGGNGRSNGHGGYTLPPSKEMAEYCHQQLSRLKNDWQRDFVADIFAVTRYTKHLSPSRLANLAKIYIEYGGKT